MEMHFTATLKQYRDRIRKWNLDKNIKKDEYRAIVRKRQGRKLVENKRELIFTVRGRKVDPGKIERWMKRHNVPESALFSPNSAGSTPPAVGCRTISEPGSPVTSRAHLTQSPFTSLAETVPSTQIFPSFSLLPSGSKIPCEKNIAYSRQSPPPTLQAFSRLVLSAINIPSSFRGPLDLATGILQHRYRQTDEERLREELYKEKALYGMCNEKALNISVESASVLKVQDIQKEIARRVVQGRQKVDGNDKLDIIHASRLQGQGSALQGLYEKAEGLYRRVFESRRQILGYQHPYTIASMSDLASVYDYQGHRTKAIELWVQLVEIQRKVLGPTYRDTLISSSNLALAYVDDDQWKEAEELQVNTLQEQQRVLGDGHPDTLISMKNLSSIYRSQTRWKDAEDVLMQVIEVKGKVLGKLHPSTLSSIASVAIVLKDQGFTKKAISIMEKCWQAQKKFCGPQHPDTLSTLGYMHTWNLDIQEV